MWPSQAKHNELVCWWLSKYFQFFSLYGASDTPVFDNSNQHVSSFKKCISDFCKQSKICFCLPHNINLWVLKIHWLCEEQSRSKFGIFSWKSPLQKAVLPGMVAHCQLICVASAATSFPEEHLWIFGENAILLGMVPRTCKLPCHFRKLERGNKIFICCNLLCAVISPRANSCNIHIFLFVD